MGAHPPIMFYACLILLYVFISGMLCNAVIRNKRIHIPLFGPLSRRGLNPIKPVYDPEWPNGRLSLTASAFNQLGQYTSSPGRRGYCYA